MGLNREGAQHKNFTLGSDRYRLTISNGLGDTEGSGSVKLLCGLRVQDRPSLHLSGQFTEGLQRVEQHGDEKNTSTSEGTRGSLGQVVETTSGNKSDGDAGKTRADQSIASA